MTMHSECDCYYYYYGILINLKCNFIKSVNHFKIHTLSGFSLPTKNRHQRLCFASETMLNWQLQYLLMDFPKLLSSVHLGTKMNRPGLRS